MRNRLFLCQVDEIDGEHERLVDFLVKAPTEAGAATQAAEHLRREWCDEPDEDAPLLADVIASFYDGTIIIRRLLVRKVMQRQAIEYFTRTMLPCSIPRK